MATTPTSRAIKNPKTRLNWRVSELLRWTMSRWLEIARKNYGPKLYLHTSLQGESEYNMTINSDLTVSCNCQDYDGSGHIGDLRKNSFEEIFFGATAQKFRDELAKGKIPIPTCSRCEICANSRAGKRRQTAFALSGNASGKHGNLQRGLHRLRAGRRGEHPDPKNDASGAIRADGRHRRAAGNGADFLFESGRTVFIAGHLPGTAVVAREKSKRIHSHFHQRRFVEYRC